MIPAQPDRVRPTLEDLLRLKRAEKPDAAFWQDFERGMRQKQLAAIIEPRPWWLGLALLSRKIGPLGMPISAGAAAMLALVVMRVSPAGGLNQIGTNSSPEPVAISLSPASSPAGSPASNPVTVSATPSTITTRTLAQPAAPAPRVASSEMANLAQPASPKLSTTPPSNASNSIPLANDRPLASEVNSLAASNPAPGARDQATSTSGLSSQVLVSAAPLPDPKISDLNAASFTPVGDELQLDKAALNPRQARLLSSATEIAESKSLASVREQALHRLEDEEQRYGAISRLGVNADRLSLKF